MGSWMALVESSLTLSGAEVATIVGAVIVGPIGAVLAVMHQLNRRADRSDASRITHFEAMLHEREETARRRDEAIERSIEAFRAFEAGARETGRVAADQNRSLVDQLARMTQVLDRVSNLQTEQLRLQDIQRRLLSKLAGDDRDDPPQKLNGHDHGR